MGNIWSCPNRKHWEYIPFVIKEKGNCENIYLNDFKEGWYLKMSSIERGLGGSVIWFSFFGQILNHITFILVIKLYDLVHIIVYYVFPPMDMILIIYLYHICLCISLTSIHFYLPFGFSYLLEQREKGHYFDSAPFMRAWFP